MGGLNPVQENRSLVVSFRYPESANTKSGLVRDLGPAQAVHFSKLIIEQVLRQTLPLDREYRGIVYYWPADKTSLVERWLGWTRRRATFEVHTSFDAGERMEAELLHAVDHRPSRVVQIGGFCLDVDRELVNYAFNALDWADAVIGPSTSGSLYLLGMRTFPDGLFSRIPWDVPDACDILTEELEKLDLVCEMLPEAVVLDSAADLERVPPVVWERLPPLVREEIRELGLGHLFDGPPPPSAPPASQAGQQRP